MYANPFTPVFGSEPLMLAGRERLIDDVLKGLGNAPGDPNRIMIFTGMRGSGKTVLLAKIASEAESRGWLSIHAAALPGMLDEFLDQIKERAKEFLPKKAAMKLTGIQAGGFGFTRDVQQEDSVGWRTQMERYLDLLAEYNVGLLFTIDEVNANTPEMIQFVSTFQIFIREKRNVAVLMAGLPNKVLQMFQNDSISFLRRAFRRKLEPISISEVRVVIKKTIALSGRSIEPEALKEAADNTQGFPFLIQLIGYHAFNQSDQEKITMDDVAAGIEDAQIDMESMIIDATIYDLSDMDMKFLIAMSGDDGDSRISDIADRLGVSAVYASVYRKRLIEQDIVSQAGRGKLAFNIPLLKTWIAEHYPAL
jgi:chromosomal replication initiation ATPase DnaA